MYQRHASWRAPSGVVVRYMVPARMGDLLPFEEVLATDLGDLYRNPDNTHLAPPLDHVVACMEWVRPLMLNEDADELLEYELSPDAVVALAITIFASASLTKPQLDNIDLAARVSADGGCECRICQNKVVGEPTERERKMCRYAEVTPLTNYLTSTAAAFLDAPDMDMPWRVFEALRVIKVASARANIARERARQRKLRIDEKLRQLGRA